MSTLHYIVVGAPGSGISSANRQSAPLQHVSVSGVIRDTVAEYTLVQTYVNPLKDATIEAAYTFPLYEGVAVSGFEAEVDGRRIVGRVQERIAARKEYEEAVKQGNVASLLEQEKPDVFQASVGNISPAKTISIRITLVSEIKQDADENQVRFVLPTTIAPRYGAPDVVHSDASKTSKLSVDIAYSAMAKQQIASIQSPSHSIQVHLGTNARVTLIADSLLDRDLVIIVQALGLDSPRALVEHHPRDGTHAVSLSFEPRFALNPLKSSELIFLVDRSGSMAGSQIKQAAEALELFLRSIPSEDHYYINIIGFGSTHQALFPRSVDYSADSLQTSTQYAQALRADMGGTDITSAFQDVFQRRRHEVPTQIFLLTDGQIWHVDTLVKCVKEAVEEGETRNSFVRVFSLGVGASVSHNLIESVARAGGGYAQLVVEGERMEKKVVTMLKAALMPPVTNVGVQWTLAENAAVEDVESGDEDFEMVEAGGDSSQPAAGVDPINLFSTEAEVPSPPPPPPSQSSPDVVIPIHQAPFKVPALYRGARFTIYAILSSNTPVPEELILRGSSPDGPVELKVNVESVQEGQTMLHSLAARALVRDLEEGASCIHALGGGAGAAAGTTVTNEQMLKRLGIHVVKKSEGNRKYNLSLPLQSEKLVVSELAKHKILELALKYNLSTKYTSWVAIDTHSDRSIIHGEVIAPDSFAAASKSGGVLMSRVRRLAVQPDIIRCAVRPSMSWNFGVQQSMFGGAGAAPLQDESTTSSSEESEDECKNNSATIATQDSHARLRSILQHQHFDGLFPLVPEVAALLSTTVEELRAKWGEFQKDHHRHVSGLQLSEPEWETLWATCVAVEFLRKQLPDLQVEWELVVEKAEKRVAAMVKSAEDVVAAIQQAAREVTVKTDQP